MMTTCKINVLLFLMISYGVAVISNASPNKGSVQFEQISGAHSRNAEIEKQLVEMAAAMEEMRATFISVLPLRTRVADLESEILDLREMVAKSNARASQQPADPTFCSCNTFNASTVSITGPAASLKVGSTASPGLINGVNVVALQNSAVKTTGDQTIRGTLEVESLTIGTWTLAQDGNGNLAINPQAAGPASRVGIVTPNVTATNTLMFGGQNIANSFQGIQGQFQGLTTAINSNTASIAWHADKLVSGNMQAVLQPVTSYGTGNFVIVNNGHLCWDARDVDVWGHECYN